MALANIQKVREIGNLPNASLLDDEILRPHLDSGARLLSKWIGTYTSATGEKRLRCMEAECCLTMYYAVPVLNTFFTQGITTLQKEMGEIDYQFHSPGDIEKIRNEWHNRAEEAVAEYMDDGDVKQIGFYAI